MSHPSRSSIGPRRWALSLSISISAVRSAAGKLLPWEALTLTLSDSSKPTKFVYHRSVMASQGYGKTPFTLGIITENIFVYLCLLLSTYSENNKNQATSKPRHNHWTWQATKPKSACDLTRSNQIKLYFTWPLRRLKNSFVLFRFVLFWFFNYTFDSKLE